MECCIALAMMYRSYGNELITCFLGILRIIWSIENAVLESWMSSLRWIQTLPCRQFLRIMWLLCNLGDCWERKSMSHTRVRTQNEAENVHDIWKNSQACETAWTPGTCTLSGLWLHVVFQNICYTRALKNFQVVRRYQFKVIQAFTSTKL